MDRWPWTFGALLAALTAARFALAAGWAPSRDEAAYWYWAWHGVDASYSLVTVGLVRIATALLGDGAFAMRLPGLVAACATVAGTVAAARRLGTTRRTALAVGAAVAASPWHVYTGTVVHPDAFLGAAAALLGWALTAPPRWIAAAGAVSVAALAKLPGALLAAPLLPALLRWRARAGVTAAVAGVFGATAALLLADADGSILRGVREFGRFGPGVGPAERVGWTVLEIVLATGPALLLAAGAGAWAMRGSEARARWPAADAAAALLAFFGAFALAGQTKGNWFAPALVLLAPPGAAALERRGSGSLLRGTALAGAVVALAGAWIAGQPAVAARLAKAAPLAALDASYARRVGAREATVSPDRTWSARAADLAGEPGVDARVRAALDEGAVAIASDDYGLVFAVARQIGRDTRVWLPFDPIFARTCGEPPRAGEEVVYVSRSPNGMPPALARAFASCEPVASARPDMPRVFRCRAFRGLAALPLLAALALPPAAAAADAPDHSDYGALLARYVTPTGVRYAAWHDAHGDRAKLLEYLSRMERVDAAALARDEAMAYWINVYNAAMLQLVLDAYPIKSPKDLGGLLGTTWEKKVFRAGGERISLDHIENGILRAKYPDARIHFALNCAARSCPPLRAEPYVADRLDEQLEDATRAFLADPAHVLVEPGKKPKLTVSKLFDWYAADFVAAAGSVPAYVARYASQMPAATPESAAIEWKLSYADYDWALNEAE